MQNRSLIWMACMLMALMLSACKKPSPGYNKGYMPEQPIPYNHVQHAGDYKIPCLYCHTHADKSKHASVPTLNVCMNCHKSVGVNLPNIKKLTEAYNNGVSIPWVKVHMLPDFVHFPHNLHINKLAGGSKEPEAVKQACFQCHGKVDTMVEVYQAEDLSMGWCLDCHRKPESNAPQNCSACHY
jgi:hypothetical protein